ncbi:MAG: NUDIX hydrolase [Erysipelotrichaceae bacterium]|nr:NUDIX hydrolase [Erysipelotrichaceae bacterium]
MSEYDLYKEIEKFVPFNEQEETDKKILLELLSNGEDILHRENLRYHLTSSAWITSYDRKKILLAYHNIYDSWSWLGGHADGESDLRKVALKEVQEESGITHARLLSDDIFSLEILTVDGHEKRGKYVPSHLHLNLTYLMEADPEDPLFIREDENSAVAWFPLEESVDASSEKWMRERIYSKLNAKLSAYKF